MHSTAKLPTQLRLSSHIRHHECDSSTDVVERRVKGILSGYFRWQGPERHCTPGQEGQKERRQAQVQQALRASGAATEQCAWFWCFCG